MELAEQIFHANAGLCRKCERRRDPVGGVMPCDVSGCDTSDHCHGSFCPHPDGALFGTGIPPANWQSIPVDVTLFGKPLPAPPPPQPIPRDEWNVFARSAAKLSRASDRGLGDVIHRCAVILGADFMTRMYTKITGADCGCGHRREKLNQLYPLR